MSLAKYEKVCNKCENARTKVILSGPSRDLLGSFKGPCRDLLWTTQGPCRDLLGITQGPPGDLGPKDLGPSSGALGVVLSAVPTRRRETFQGPSRDLPRDLPRDLLGAQAHDGITSSPREQLSFHRNSQEFLGVPRNSQDFVGIHRNSCDFLGFRVKVDDSSSSLYSVEEIGLFPNKSNFHFCVCISCT